MDYEPAQRFYQAALAAAHNAGIADHVPQLLARFGLPGLMTRIGTDPPVPGDRALGTAQKLAHTLLLEHARELAARLGPTGARHFFAKGIALAGTVYQPGDRTLADIDLYVPEEEDEPVLAVLHELGYHALPERDQSGPRELRSTHALQREATHAVSRVLVDLHWTLDPVERVLPRRDRPIPDRIWGSVAHTGEFPTPSPEHHAALLAHHLVHTDLLHVRSLLDLAFVFATIAPNGGGEYLATCRQLRIGRFAALLAESMARDFGIERPAAVGDGPTRWNRFTRDLTLERWLTLVAQSPVDDDGIITVARLRRRQQLLDHSALKTLGQDVLLPPRAFLRWRWGGHDLWAAALLHYGQLLRKALRPRV